MHPFPGCERFWVNHMKKKNPLQTRGPCGSILPRPLRFEDGTRADLALLCRHHYRPGMPATYCLIRVARTRDRHSKNWRTIGVAVLSWPVPMMAARNRRFGMRDYKQCLRFANSNLRTISRVIVHPQFRAAGIAQELVRQLITRCPTRYIESATSMGAFASFLVRCGFKPLDTLGGEPAYFLLDRRDA